MNLLKQFGLTILFCMGLSTPCFAKTVAFYNLPPEEDQIILTEAVEQINAAVKWPLLTVTSRDATPDIIVTPVFFFEDSDTEGLTLMVGEPRGCSIRTGFRTQTTQTISCHS